MPAITAPASGSTHPAGSTITVSGTGGPIVSITITVPGQPNIVIPIMNSAANWSHMITLPNYPNVAITITATNDTGETVSRPISLS
jgi:hypothetical protein